MVGEVAEEHMEKSGLQNQKGETLNPNSPLQGVWRVQEITTQQKGRVLFPKKKKIPGKGESRRRFRKLKGESEPQSRQSH